MAEDAFISVKEIDAEMHSSRLDGYEQRRFNAQAGALPEGTFVCFEDGPGQPHLLWGDQAYPWTHNGYGIGRIYGKQDTVEVLTPGFSVNVLAAGYKPVVRLDQDHRQQEA